MRNRLVVPVTTCITNDNLRVVANDNHMKWLSSQRIKAVLVGGTTGRGWEISTYQIMILLKLALQYFDEVYINVSLMTKEEIQDLARFLFENKSKSSVYLVYAPNESSIWEGFSDKDRCLDILKSLIVVPNSGLLLYDIDLPGITRPVKNQLIGELSCSPDFLGLKDSRSTEKSEIASRIKLVQDMGKKFFSGPDSALSLVGELGGYGRVSGMANLLPKTVLDLVENPSKKELQCKIDEAFQALLEYSPDDFVAAIETIILFQRDKEMLPASERDKASELFDKFYPKAV